MPVKINGKLKSFSDESIKSFENNVVKYEKAVIRKKQADATLERSNKKTGNFGLATGSNGDILPSAFLRKQRKLESQGLLGGRNVQSNEKTRSEKIRAKTEEGKFSVTDGIMSALGIRTGSKSRLAKDSLTTGQGAPLKSSNEFKKMQSKITAMESNQKAFAKMFTGGQALVSGASGLTSIAGLSSTALSLASKIPYVASIIAIAITTAKLYVDQYGSGKTRDTRVHRLDESSAMTSVSDETEILGGERLFLSNPNIDHGLPQGNSNTQHMRAGIRTHKLRRDGIYY